MADFKFVWKIDNYNFLPPQRGKALKSPLFSVNLLGSTYLELYPKGDILDPDGDSIIMCLKNCKKLPHTTVWCSLQLVCGELKVGFSTEKIHDYAKWRFKEIGTKFTNGRSIDDFDKTTLIVTCSFNCTATKESPATAEEKDIALLSEDMKKMYISQQFSDLTLCSGTVKFPTHRSVLYARVPKLFMKLESEFGPDSSQIIDVPDIESPVLQMLLEYVYSGKLDASSVDVPSGLYKAAEAYELTDLKKKLYSYPNEVIARTCIKIGRNVFFWPIQNVRKLERNKKYYSPSFTGGVIPGSDLKLVCYIIADFNGEDTFVIRIRRLFPTKDNPIFVKCKITVLEFLTLNRTAEHLFNSDEEWHFPSFFSITRKDGLAFVSQRGASHKIETGEISLKCEFWISGGEIAEIEETECSSKNENFTRSSEDTRSFCRDIGLLYNIFLPKVSDITLQIGDVRFPAHKVVLAARSPVFSRMFESDMLEKQSGVVDIKDIEIPVLNMTLTYMYSAKLDVLSYDSAVKLYAVADKYEITSLKQKCVSLMKKFLTKFNVCEILILSDMHNDSELKKLSIDFICAHGDQILGTLEWKNLIDSKIELASHVLHTLSDIYKVRNQACMFCEKVNQE